MYGQQQVAALPAPAFVAAAVNTIWVTDTTGQNDLYPGNNHAAYAGFQADAMPAVNTAAAAVNRAHWVGAVHQNPPAHAAVNNVFPRGTGRCSEDKLLQYLDNHV